jgi:iron(III) transport system ATP-binding protein
MSFLELAHVSKRFGAVTAVDTVSLSVAAGSRTAIVGPSGSGKTTLLRLIAGFETPDAGTIRLDGALLVSGQIQVPAHLRGIGIVAQDGALFPHLTIADNIGFGLDRSDPGRRARIADLLELVELTPDMLARKPDELSGGQQQRVSLARALARQPRLMLLDEPFSALDTGLRTQTRKAVARLLEAAGITTILVTHDQSEAMSFADQIAVMAKGRLEQAGSPAEVYFHPRNQIVADLLGEAIVLPAVVADGFADCALGRVTTDDASRRGAATIMLRPEQVSLERPASGQSSEVKARVLDVDFHGSVSTLSVVLLDSPQTQPLTLPMTSAAAPAKDAIVAIGVTGAAHVFPVG